VKELPIGQGRLNIRMTSEEVRLDGSGLPRRIAVYRPGHGLEFKEVDRLPAVVRWDR
jgi:hypothetical protein